MARKGKGSDENRDLFLAGAAEALLSAKERGYPAAFLSAAVAKAKRRGWNGTWEDALRILSEVAVPHVGRWVTYHERGSRCPMCDSPGAKGGAGGDRPEPDPKAVFGLK